MAEFDPRAFTPFRAAVQLACARLILYPLFLLFHRVHVSGVENIPKEGALLVVSNHLSALDSPLVLTVCDRPMAFLAKIKLFRVPVLGAFIKFGGAVSLNRAHPGLGTFKEVKEIFKRQWALSVCIEGTRNKTPGVLRRPQLGPAYIASLYQVPILPIGIVGTNKAWGKAEVRVGKVLKPADDLNLTTWQIMDELSHLTGFSLPPRELSPRRRQTRQAATRPIAETA